MLKLFKKLFSSETPKETPAITIVTDGGIAGFSVLSVEYPNHSEPAGTVTAEELANRFAYAMHVEWFGKAEGMRHFAVTAAIPGSAGDLEGYGFHFGPFDDDADDFTIRHTAIVRETAGGGFMLLVQDALEPAYRETMKPLFGRTANRETAAPPTREATASQLDMQ